MAVIVGPLTLATVGSTGANNHTGVQVNAGVRSYAVDFLVEAVGATPTVTYKLQGSLDGGANWIDVIAVPSDSDTAAVSQTVTATGHKYTYVEKSERFFTNVRLVTSANTNVTYSAALYVEE